MIEEKVSKKSNYGDVEALLTNFAKIIDSLGEYLIEVGEVEKKNPEFKNLIESMRDDPTLLEKAIDKVPEEISNSLLSLLLRMVMIQNKAKHMDSLEPDKKIEVGTELRNMSKDFKALNKKLSKIEK